MSLWAVWALVSTVHWEPLCCFTQIEVGVSWKLRWLDLWGDLLTHWQVTLAVGWHSARAAERCTWACLSFSWHGVWVLSWNLPRTRSPSGRTWMLPVHLRALPAPCTVSLRLGPEWWALSRVRLLSDHIVEKPAGWEIFLWPTLGNLICRRGTVLRFYT